MNKLMGFYELKNMRLPSIHWKQYTGNEVLTPNVLWTIRCAVFSGDDLNLPRLVGAKAFEAKQFADKLLENIGKNGIVLYYPYFIAEKSGTFNVFKDKIIIEAVKKDLWNLVTYSYRDVTIFVTPLGVEYDGDSSFLTSNEIQNILAYVPDVKRIFRDMLIEGKSVLFEWSYAYDCDTNKNIIGEKYLVFYEARKV